MRATYAKRGESEQRREIVYKKVCVLARLLQNRDYL